VHPLPAVQSVAASNARHATPDKDRPHPFPCGLSTFPGEVSSSRAGAAGLRRCWRPQVY